MEEMFPKPNDFHENQKISDSSELELSGMDISELYAMLSDIANEGISKLSFDLIINLMIFSAPAYTDLDGNVGGSPYDYSWSSFVLFIFYRWH